MQQSSNNNLCTVLLLLALGYLIYYLLNNNKNENETENFSIFDKIGNAVSSVVNKVAPKKTKEPQKTKEPLNNGPEYFTENYEKPEYVMDNTNNKYNLENGLDNAEYVMNNNINNSGNINSESQMEITNTQVAQNAQNVVNSITKQNSGVNDFKAFDDDYTPFTNLNGSADNYGGTVGWSDLDNAFGPLPNTQNTMDLVKMNQSEMKNYNSNDFLPKEIIKDSFEDVSQAKYNVDDNNLINTDRYVIGINTVGQSLKNGSHDIRGTIPNPKFTVSPWNNSTYEPDYNIKPLC